MTDKRLTLRLTEYWNSLRGDALLPEWERFDNSEFADIWQQCCDWRVDTGEGNTVVFTYDHVGESVKEKVSKDLTGKKFTTSSRILPGAPVTKNIVGAILAEQLFTNDFKGFPAASIVKRIDRVLNNLVPVMDEGRFENDAHKTVRYRSCMLPFGDASGKVQRLVLGLSWKAF